MREVFEALCGVLNKQGVENPSVLFRETTEAERQKLISLVGTEATTFTAFYEKYQPDDLVTFAKADINFLSIERIVEEIEGMAPSYYLKDFGIIPFASTTGGNVLAIDTNGIKGGDPRVLIIDHQFLYEDANEPGKLWIDSGFVSKAAADFFDDDCEATVENLQRGAIELEGSFVRFLQRLSRDEYDEVEDYMDEQAAWNTEEE